MKKILVLAAAALFVLGTSTPSRAVADFDIGASVRIDLGWQYSDLGDSQGPTGEDSQIQFFLVNPGNGRINFKTTVGDVTGFLEFGMGPSLRHIYASWDLGGGMSFLFGHTWSLASFGFTDQRLNGDLALIGYGCMYWGRVPQVRLTMAQEMFTLKVALEDNRIADPGLAGAQITENWIPALVVAADISPMEMLTFTPSVYFSYYELTGAVPGAGDDSVMSWAFALDGRVKPIDILRISYELWIGQNAAGVGDGRPNVGDPVMGAPVADATGTGVEDVLAYGGFVQLTFPLEVLTINTGAGLQFAEVENSPSALYEDDLMTWGFFVNVLYNLTDNLYIQPELAWFDNGDDGLKAVGDLGWDIFMGVHIQADF